MYLVKLTPYFIERRKYVFGVNNLFFVSLATVNLTLLGYLFSSIGFDGYNNNDYDDDDDDDDDDGNIVEVLVLKRYCNRKKWFLRNNERGFESKENCFEREFKLYMHR